MPEILDFDAVTACIYNVYVAGAGEIISGRVTDASGAPIKGAAVSAVTEEQDTYQVTTNSRGIYALTKLPPLTIFHITVDKLGYAFRPRSIYAGASRDYHVSSGNRWGIDFAGSAIADADDDGDVDLCDFALLARRWGIGREATAEEGDEAIVDFHTLMDLIDQWLLGVALDVPVPVED
ncbi:MAG: carboxypeptidase regulatory-like domain-containing protein [Phycisphaerales bacterium]|nr:MAG: carboxypeptidase regulatory-like domain-containing protein [Phycisphaerales bacterium]